VNRLIATPSKNLALHQEHPPNRKRRYSKSRSPPQRSPEMMDFGLEPLSVEKTEHASPWGAGWCSRPRFHRGIRSSPSRRRCNTRNRFMSFTRALLRAKNRAPEGRRIVCSKYWRAGSALAISPLPSLAESAAALSVVVRRRSERITNPLASSRRSSRENQPCPLKAWGSSTPSGLGTLRSFKWLMASTTSRFASKHRRWCRADDRDRRCVRRSQACREHCNQLFLSSDLAMFESEFGLPNPPSFLKLNEYGAR